MFSAKSEFMHTTKSGKAKVKTGTKMSERMGEKAENG